ncbi:MAG: Fe-S cluster assembly protein SufD [Gemmatimonadota bacterium]|nr:Fe-S cluster assembly protein SufD [Gemmatimonadota bacterium]
MTQAQPTTTNQTDDLKSAPHSLSRRAYQSDFERLASGALQSEPEWLARLRRDSFASFESLGFPTMKNEDWHFTSVAPIADRVFHPAEPKALSVDDSESFLLPQLGGPTITFVNGQYSAELSTEIAGGKSGVSFESLSNAIARDLDGSLSRLLGSIAVPGSSAFTALNSAFFRDGALLRIAASAVADAPIHLVFIAAGGDGSVSHPRNLIIAGAHSRATIVESYVTLGDAESFTNAVTEVTLGEGARLSHYKLQSESPRAFHVGTIQAYQSRNSWYESFSFATGADLSRTNVYTVLGGDAAECVLNGLYLADGTQHMDHQTYVEHVAPNCPSHELYKGILDGRSHGVFNGKVYVHPEAQKTDGKQSNNNLLLSSHARVDTKPQLEIFADDVKCTHGATVGRLDETALFYLRSRGIGMEMARQLLTYAFAADVLERLELAPLKEALEARVLRRFTASA